MVVPDPDGVDEDGLGRSVVPSLAHPPATSISTKLMAASESGAVIPKMCRHVRVIDGPLRNIQTPGVCHRAPGHHRDRSLQACILAPSEPMTSQNASTSQQFRRHESQPRERQHATSEERVQTGKSLFINGDISTLVLGLLPVST